jgi:hypothetical protein
MNNFVIKTAKIFGISVFLFSISLFANAQFSGVGEVVSFDITPSNPKANQIVTVEIESFSIDLDRASRITWLVDGEIMAQKAGLKTVQFRTGKLGSRSDVEVVIQSAESGTVRQSVTIRPTEVNLLWEASSYTPPFYLGKALPASDADITVVAMAEFITSNGNKLSADDLIFTWEKDGKVLGSLSGRGKDTLRVVGPKISRISRIDVEVSSTGGTLQGKGTTFISAVSPKIVFYENNTVFGVRYEEAIDDRFTLLSEEVKITAHPYFFSSNTRVVPSSSYQWRVDGSLVESAPDDNSSIVLRQVGDGEGSATVSLSIESANKILQFAKSSFSMFFGLGESAETLFTF